ncbi:MAG: heme biosynthesis protein HemY [Rhizobiaceae bacterium]|nr:heme biosynthesis protein HemY [Rhizobiaceae bacterium]
MIRVLFFIVIVLMLGLGFAWLADRPGDMVVTFGGYQYRVSLMVAALAVTATVAAVMVGWWLIKSIWRGPYRISRYFRVRQRDRGYQALSSGMIAAGAGDAALARKMNRQAARLIRAETEPLIHLLDAQASLLEGDHEAARTKFERMLDDPELRLLGLRGLYLQAERLDDRAAARHYAARAAEVAPQLEWAAEATFEERTARGDWDAALQLIDARTAPGPAAREAVGRRRAVLLTAKAMEVLDSDPAAARAAALEAVRLQPYFPPAAAVAAKALFRQNDLRKASKILETAWKAEPHPELADLYVHGRPGDAALDRLQRARRLESLHPNHPESSLAVARAALEAREYQAARDAAEAAIRMQNREAGWLLLADIEEAETGDQGRMRQYLARAMRAPGDPTWVADGFVSDRWAPASPVTGKLDAFEWRPPVERLGHLIEQGDLEADLARPALAPPEPAEAAEAPIEIGAGEEPSPGQPAASPAVEYAAQGEVDAHAASTGDGEAVEPPDPASVAGEEPPRLPDDPGIEPDDGEESSQRRFRLF